MEKVLYNTILGARPIQADGHSFYYSDYNNSATKFYHSDKWPCCSGTFPQITADYGISSWFSSPQGLYVNLFVPSRVVWVRSGARISIEQSTHYPYSPDVGLHVKTNRPEAFAVYLRVPAWAGSGTKIAVNGRAVAADLRPGTFAAIHREWRNGDRIEYSIDMPLRLEAVDLKHPNLQALLAGPLTLFSVDSLDSRFSRGQLLSAKQKSPDSMEWQVDTSAGSVTLRSFPAIRDEKYRLYQEVEL
jgi:DUF1680 family protein